MESNDGNKLVNSQDRMPGYQTIEDIKNSFVEYDGYMVWKTGLETVRQLREIEVREDDVFVTSYPKSGTTWLQEIVWLICHDADTETTNQRLTERFPYVELTPENFGRVVNNPGQRFIKSHMPIELLPKAIKEVKPKILHVARNPKDILVSFYYFLRILKKSAYGGTLEELHTTLIADEIAFGPWWKHVLGYWLKREEENILFLKYEDMIKDLTSVIKSVAKFLNKDLTDQQISTIVEHTNFQKMKVNKAVNMSLMPDRGIVRGDAETNFMRKGKVGDWRNHFTQEMSDATDKMVEERLYPHGLQFEDTLP